MRQFPIGKATPPPLDAAHINAAWIAALSSVAPSHLAPHSFTLRKVIFAVGRKSLMRMLLGLVYESDPVSPESQPNPLSPQP